MNLITMLPPGPYAILPEVGNHILQTFQSIDLHVHLAEFEAQRAIRAETKPAFGAGAYPSEAKKPNKPYDMSDSVAVISITGPLSKDGGSSLSDNTSTVRVRRMVRMASNDPDVTAIALLIDSPGGQVAGTGDLAADVRQAAQKKPLYAYIEDCGASAAYWIASQANAIYANPTAMVGSIGTYMVIPDSSGLADNLGVKVHVIKAGDFKGAGVDGAPVTPDQMAHFQQLVNDLNSQFTAVVAKGRGFNSDRMSQLADGRVHIGAKARSEGLVDGITSFDNVLAKLKSYKPATKAS